MPTTAIDSAGALVLIGDKVGPQPYLKNLIDMLRAENDALPESRKVQYVVCRDAAALAIALREFRERIALVLVGPGLKGKQDMIARMIGGRLKSVLVLDPKVPLADTIEQSKRLLNNLVELGVSVSLDSQALGSFWEPIVRDQVIAGLAPNLDMASMTPDQRAEQIDKRLESVTRFPSLPETQTKVAALDDMDHPKKWAEAINPDLPMKTVILNLLNSAHYSFRSRITTIEQAVSLASARTIREVVLACTVQRLFSNVEAARIHQFWRHSVACGFFAKILSLPADPDEQSPQEKTEFSRLDLEEEQANWLRERKLWKQFEVPKDGDAFTAGLLHDIGKVTIALCFEDALSLFDPIVAKGVQEADAANEVWADSPCKIERSLMTDIDHQVIGGRLARRWGLAPVMQEVITQHHHVRRSSNPLVHLVGLADLAANSLISYPYQGDQHPFTRMFQPLDELLKSQPDEDQSAAIDEAWPNLVESGLENILTGYEVPEVLWKPVDASPFFRFVYLLRPRVKKLTNSFLQMTAQKA